MMSTSSKLPTRLLSTVAGLTLMVLSTVGAALAEPASQAAKAGEPTVEEATRFAAEAEQQLLAAWIYRERTAWIQSTYITHDTELLAAEADQKVIELNVELAGQATRFDKLELPYDVRRKLDRIKLDLTMPAPPNAADTAELARISAGLQSRYGRHRYCPEGGECLSEEDISSIMRTSHDADELLDAWQGWREVSKPMRDDFARYVELANKGAQGLGFADLGAMWRSKYDMDPDAFAAELDRLWTQVKPLYDALHCHVRAGLAEAYGGDVVDTAKPIPAHLLGNIWAQTWLNVFDRVAPGDSDPGYDVTELLEEHGIDQLEMVRRAERFFTSLGFAPLPETFWERSMFLKPADRDVICHASAWDVGWDGDLRIKMCIDVTGEEFDVVHHELGHNFYYQAYDSLPPLYKNSANDGFHEAVGDTVALSVTPKYLVDIGLLDQEPDASSDLGLLLRRALDKVAFLPFGLLIDQWRWKVFSGEITPENYNRSWWELREKYQGIAPAVARSEADFDPGAKYHVAANVPYTRYFLAHILQFQFHRELCKAAGYEGPLHRCTIYGSDEAGKRLRDMLGMGASRPWQEALEALAGTREMDATAIIDYFAPLKVWLDEQNEGRTCGW